MTVSPGGPQDAKGPTPEVADGGNLEAIAKEAEAIAKEVLPPTLFQLPNLKPIHPTSKPMIPAGQDADSLAASAWDSDRRHEGAQLVDLSLPATPAVGTVPAAGVDEQAFAVSDQGPLVERPDVSVMPVPDAIGTTRESRLADFPASTPDEGSSTPPIPPARLPIEVPAGRAWSESIGSQGIVIALLVLVVAAALMSRRGADDDSTESALAEHSDLLEFDRGESIVIPETGLTETGNPRAEMLKYGRPGVGVTPETHRENWANSSFSDRSASSDVPGVPDITEVASVALESPMADNSVAKSEVDPSADDVRESPFFDGSSQVEAQTVSDRSDTVVASGLDGGADSVVSHRKSSTPAEMNNLLQYLPPLPESVTQAPAVGIGAQTDPSYAK